MKFNELEILPEILRAVDDMGFDELSPIQEKAIPPFLEGKDIIGQAQTGTGKTASFGIPILQKVDPEIKMPQALILCPTRELAVQISNELHHLAKYMQGIKILPVYGGTDFSRQIKALKSVQIVVGTPGRVMDHLRRKTLKCPNLQMLILDEADEMLNMGFREDIETVISYLPEERQTALFSATMPKEILEITDQYQKPDVVKLKITKKELTVGKIAQYYYDIRHKEKEDVLVRLLKFHDPKQALVFCNTKSKTDELAKTLQQKGYAAEALHGDLKQQQRDIVMNNFRYGKTAILVATDVAARGIDIDDLDAVFNYDLPQDDEYYVHRIGRTGRAGKEGAAYSLIRHKELYKLREIERYCKTKIKEQPLPSAKDVEEARCDKVMEEVIDIIDHKDLDRMRKLVRAYVADGRYSEMDLAAALLYQTLGMSEPKEKDGVEIGPRNSEFTHANGKEAGMVRIFINIGKSSHVRPGDILGAVAGESGMPGNRVGEIDMYEDYTFVEVPLEYGDLVLNGLRNTKIRGKAVNAEPAR